MIAKQMDTHEELVAKAPTVVNDRVAPIYLRQMQVLHKAERFKPSYNQMKQRHDDDIVMANLIKDARCTCENRLDGHILRFKELRQKHPNFVPGWLKRYEDAKSMEVHETIIKKARKWIDDEPPTRALHYRQVLKKTPFTRGGFPRIVTMPKPKPRRRRRKKRAPAQTLPARRTTASRQGRPEDQMDPFDITGEEPGNTQVDELGNTTATTSPEAGLSPEKEDEDYEDLYEDDFDNE